MSLFSKLFGANKNDIDEINKENTSRSESAAALNSQEEEPDSNELVAVIMAALMSMFSSDVRSELQIKSIRRIGRNTPVWNNAGRDEYIASKF